MIQAYTKSRCAFWAVRAAALVIIVVLWIHDLRLGYQLYIPIVATVLLAGIGYFLSRLLGNLISSVENTKVLGYLHVELDPEKFIASYRGVPDKMKQGTRDRAVSSAYLADGYFSAGDAADAVKTLDKGFEGLDLSGKYPLAGLYHGNRLQYLIGMKDWEGAKEEAAQLEGIITACEKSNKALAENLSSALRTRKARIGIAEGQKADSAFLKEEVKKAQYNLRRLELYETLRENALLKNDKKEAREYADKMKAEGGKTFYAQ